MKYKFNILKDGVEEPWSGSFESEMKAQEWYENFGKKKEAEGFELIKKNYAKGRDIQRHIELKLQYNTNRKSKHGKRY